MMHRTSVVSLEAPIPAPELLQRESTLTTYMTRDIVDSFVAKINRQYRRDGKQKDPRPINSLKWGIKPKIKSMLYSHNLWGGSYYGKVLTRANISEKLFMDSALSAKPKLSLEVTPRYKSDDCFLKLVSNGSPCSATNKGAVSQHIPKQNELEEYEYQLEKQQELKSMHSRQKSAYNRFLDMVSSNLAEPRTLDQRIERQKLLNRCESYKHLRDVPRLSTAPKQKTPRTKQAFTVNQLQYKQVMRQSMDILQNCRTQHTQNKQMRTSLHAFGGFCKTIDRYLLRRKKQLTINELL